MTCSNRLRPARPRSRCVATGCPTRPCARACKRRASAGWGWSGAAAWARSRPPGWPTSSNAACPRRALRAHCLAHARPPALAGWPAQDILRRLQHRRAQQPAQAVILKLLQAIDAEQSLETFEDILGEDPLLAYRFLVSANSAALDLRTGISSLRRGLVMMGCLALRRWLAELRPDAST